MESQTDNIPEQLKKRGRGGVVNVLHELISDTERVKISPNQVSQEKQSQNLNGL